MKMKHGVVVWYVGHMSFTPDSTVTVHLVGVDTIYAQACEPYFAVALLPPSIVI